MNRKPDPTVHRADRPLAHLAVPMLLENFLRIALSGADVFMLSFYSQSAVAAVGLIGNFSYFITLLYSMISAGALVLMAQFLGAGREREAGDAAVAGFALAFLFSAGLSLALALGAHGIVSLYRLEPDVYAYARQYLVIYGGGSVFVALNIVQTAVLRAWGHPQDAMWANMAANVLNIIGNSLALFGLFGLPVTGVVGVAVSTVASQAAACVILALRIRGRKEIRLPWKDFLSVPLSMYRRLLRIGVPTAGENIAYNIAQLANSWIMALFGTAALSAHVIALTLVRFVFIPAFSIGQAAQIKVGYLVGSRRFDDARRKVFAWSAAGLAVSMGATAILYAFRSPVIRFFTTDPVTAALISTLLLISFAREIGRVPNVIVIPALKGSGDVVYPALIGVPFMWGLGVAGSWLLGVSLGFGIAGVWAALAADEWVRGILMIRRWAGRAWRTKALITPTEG